MPDTLAAELAAELAELRVRLNSGKIGNPAARTQLAIKDAPRLLAALEAVLDVAEFDYDVYSGLEIRQAITRALTGRDADVVAAAPEPVWHAWPHDDIDGPLPCCGRTRAQVSEQDRIAFAKSAVTCRG